MYWKTWSGYLLVKADILLFERLRVSATMTKLLFGVDVMADIRLQYWDFVTLLFRKVLKKYVMPSQKVLEIGTGENAILSISVIKSTDISLTAVDKVPDIVVNAKKSMSRNKVSFDIKLSNIFSNCNGPFDIIFWNLPYVPTSCGISAKAGRVADDALWDGGPDGADLIRRFINEAPPFLKKNGKILAGITTFYVPYAEVEKIIEESSFRLEKAVSSWWNPSKVFVLTLK